MTSVYTMLTRLSIYNQQKSSNAYIITFGPHNSDFNEIIKCFQINLRILDRDNVFEINKHK